MDLGDLIIPILIIGSVIVQWLGSSKKNDEEQGAPPELPTEYPSEPQKSGSDPSWDDLMEALGQPSAPPEVPPVAEQRSATPPPVPAATPAPAVEYQAPEQPAYLSVLDRQKKRLEEKQRQLEQVKQQTKVQLPNSGSASPQPATVRHRPIGSLNLRGMLNNRKSLKQAIVLNEILQPPVSLR
ncbi:MAG: hypothetical protein KTR33_12830 [Gammaproteobacteria bacterium]|nr:hypothetical protein [Gammaproteobacteria bacterium]